MLTLIVAIADGHAIGVNNSLPWKIKEDLQFFRNKTLDKKVIMGRRTFESIGKPLAGRTNIVLSRGNDIKHPGVTVLKLNEVIELASSDEEVFVIGGSQIYELLLPYVQRMHITDIFLDVQEADAFFPIYDLSEWETTSVTSSNEDGVFYDFIQYDRRSNNKTLLG